MIVALTVVLVSGATADLSKAQFNPGTSEPNPSEFDTATPTQQDSGGTNVTGSSPTPTNTNTTGSSPSPTNTNTTGSSPNPTNTNTTGSNGGTFFLQNPLSDKFDSVGGLVSGFVEIFTYLVVIGAVLALIWVGLQFVLAQGNPARLSELKTWLLYIVIGLALVIGARIIVLVVINTLQATGTVSPGVINSAREGLQGN